MNINEYIQTSIETKKKIFEDKELIDTIRKAADRIALAYKNNNRVFTAGNGGSAADAQHIAGELVSKLFVDRPALDAFALTTNSSILTAVSNDYGYENVFSRQILAFAKKGDIFLVLSTSGESENIVNALKAAKTTGVVTIGLTGKKPCKLDSLCDYLIKVPSDVTPLVQESHIMIGHIICATVEESVFKK